eukprot:751618_1
MSCHILVHSGVLFDNTLVYLELMRQWGEPFYLHMPCCAQGWMSTGKRSGGNEIRLDVSTSSSRAQLYVNSLDIAANPPTISFYWDNSGIPTYMCRGAGGNGLYHSTQYSSNCVFRIYEAGTTIPMLNSNSINMKSIELRCTNNNRARNMDNSIDRYLSCNSQGGGSGMSKIYLVPVNSLTNTPTSAPTKSPTTPTLNPSVNP